MAFGFFKKIGKGIGSAAKSLARNPLVKLTATGAAFVFPPVGIPATIAITTTDKLLNATKSADPVKRRAAVGMVTRTAALAKGGDHDAKRGMQLLLKRKRELTGAQPAGRRRFENAYVVTPQGRIAYRGRVETV